MNDSDSWSCFDSGTTSGRTDEAWDWISGTESFDADSKASTLPFEDADVVLPPPAPPSPLSPPCRTVWEILTAQLAESAFEANSVEPEQREANEAAVKKRFQLDPTKRHTYTSRCGRHQVVGYFNLYARGIVGLFTEGGFPVYVKLDELAPESIQYVVDKLGHPLRGKVEAQLSAN